jgi:CBS domain-containing protein
VGLFTQREALEARAAPPEATVETFMTPALLCLQHGTPLHRAAALAVATRARRVLALDGRHVVGMLTGLDFCRALRSA